MDEIMSKILKKFVCENGDCRSNEFKIGPLISLIAVNILIGIFSSLHRQNDLKWNPLQLQ